MLFEREDWARRLGRWAVAGALLLLLIIPAAMLLARYDTIPKVAGLATLLAGGGLALIVFALGGAALWIDRSKPFAARWRIWSAAGAALAYAVLVGSYLPGALAAPPLHDVTTNLARPPRFEVLPLRADNLAGMGSLQDWRKLHAHAYTDLKPRALAAPAAEVTARALALARAEGWSIVSADLARGRIEATATVSYLRFHDDVIIEISPATGGQGAQVNMRSVSREGAWDFGRNARRIRAFLDAL